MSHEICEKSQMSQNFAETSCYLDGGTNDPVDNTLEEPLTFFRVFQLLKLSFAVSVHHQTMIFLNQLPILRVVC